MVHLMKALKVISLKGCGGWCLSTTKFRVSQYEEQYSGAQWLKSALHYTTPDSTRLQYKSVQFSTQVFLHLQATLRPD